MYFNINAVRCHLIDHAHLAVPDSLIDPILHYIVYNYKCTKGAFVIINFFCLLGSLKFEAIHVPCSKYSSNYTVIRQQFIQACGSLPTCQENCHVLLYYSI